VQAAITATIIHCLGEEYNNKQCLHFVNQAFERLYQSTPVKFFVDNAYLQAEISESNLTCKKHVKQARHSKVLLRNCWVTAASDRFCTFQQHQNTDSKSQWTSQCLSRTWPDNSSAVWVKVLRPTWHKIGHFGDVFPSQSLGTVLKKLNLTQKHTYTNKLWHKIIPTRMWANAQRDGRPAKYRWFPLFNATKFGWRPLSECRAVTMPRRETRWN